MVKPRSFRLVETPSPVLKQKGWIVVRLENALICGSDMPAFTGTKPGFIYPLLPGTHLHECSGEVVESRSSHFHIGDRVVAIPHEDQGLAEYFLSDEQSACLVPEALEDTWLAPLIQPLSTVILATDRLGDVNDRSIVVLGAGPIGIMTALALNMQGAHPVRIMDPLESRCELAKGFGIDGVLALSSTAARASQQGNLFCWPESDICVEAVGHGEETLNDAVTFVKNGGTILALGVPDQPVYAIEYERLFRKNIRLIASVTPDWPIYLKRAGEMMIQHSSTLCRLITHRFPVRDAEDAFRFYEQKPEKVGKVLLDGTNWEGTRNYRVSQ